MAGTRLGLRPEQTLAEARAVCPELEVVEADPAADQASLERLAAWCERYSPLATACTPDGLWLDITGCGQFFSSEQELTQDLRNRLSRAGLDARIALASTAGAAWALARSPTARLDCTVVQSGEERVALEPLTLALLRLDPRTVAGLRRVGLRSIGELARQPRGELTSRYGADAVLRLDQAMGRAAEAIVWPHPLPPWEERVGFAEPISTPSDLGQALYILSTRLCERLAAKGRGGQLFSARFFRIDDLAQHITIATAQPVRDPAYVARLLRMKLETIDPGLGIEVMTLQAETVSQFETPQSRLGDFAVPEELALAAVVDELANRLGARRVWRVEPRESHIPDHAVSRVMPLTQRKTVAEWMRDPSRPRPIRLFRTPEPIESVIFLVPYEPPIAFRWRGATRRMRAADGPERIGPEWWRQSGDSDDAVRDYYRVEDTNGARYWIFRAGLVEETRAPRWYVHGLFG